VQEKQIDLSAHVERVKRRTRPWKSIIALALAIAAAIISKAARHDSHALFTASHQTNQLVAAVTAFLFLVFASMATYGLAGQVRQMLEPRVGTAHAAIIGYGILILGAFTTLVITLDLFGVPASQLVLGGALTTVFISIAAQQALSNVFAGLVLLFARPFRVGDPVRLRASAIGGTLDGTVTDIGITYVRFRSGNSVMSIPNSQVLNAVVGPIPPAETDADQAPVPGSGRSGTVVGPEQAQPAPPEPV
jgi:small-conductance mechanosensitive channel